jgi:hypothetical protein
MREGRDVYMVLLRKSEVRRPLGRPRCRRDYNIKANLQELGCGGMDLFVLAHDRNR